MPPNRRGPAPSTAHVWPRRFLAGLSLALFSGPAVNLAHTQEVTDLTNRTDLSVVATQGNSESLSVALANELTYRSGRSRVTVDLSLLRSRTVERGDPELIDGQLVVPEQEASTEVYVASTRYRYDLTTRFLLGGGGGWERDRRAGIDDRFTFRAGLGYTVLESPTDTLVVEMGGDYTDESRVGGDRDAFAGAQLYVTYRRRLTETAEARSSLEVLENLEDTGDLRANWTGAVTAALSQTLALKVSYTVRYDRQPVELPVAGAPGTTFPLESTDTRLAASLVVTL